MIGVTAIMVMCWAVIWHAPETAIGRVLHHLLVEAPAARLCRITRGDVAVAILLIFAAVMIAFAGEGDGIRLLTWAAPDVAMWITTFEVSAYLDIVMAIAIAASNLQMRTLTARAFGPVLRRTRVQTGRARRTANRSAANDDDDHRTARTIAA